MKKVVSMLILAVMLVSCLQISAFAAVPPTVEPMWDNTSRVSGTMVFDGTTGTTGSRVVGKPGVNRIEGSCTVYKLVGSEWVYVTSQSKTVTTMSCYIEIEFEGEIGYEYKAEFTFVVYKNGVGETVQGTASAVCK